jgi:alkylation response protein AidB-like acyl-CoA dehydrogenase
VPRDAEGVSERQRWDGIGMRASANHGIDLDSVFIPADAALTVPGAFVRMMQVSRGTFVGNQLAATAVYAGIAQSVFDEALARTTKMTFADTGAPLNTSPMHQVMFGQMAEHLESSYLWLRRQLELETSEPPLLPKPEVVKQWRIAKGGIAEHAFQVATLAFKACGTSGSINTGVIARALRDTAMGLVMAFPAERGRLDAAQMITQEKANNPFASR